MKFQNLENSVLKNMSITEQLKNELKIKVKLN
jgi:hypothetical protein